MTVKNTLHQLTLALRQLTLAACFLIASQTTPATAQPGLLQDDAFCGDCCDHDMQLFSPLEFDFDCQPMRKDCGYFFSYDKLSWAFTGERTTLGDQGRTVLAEEVFLQNAQDEGVRPDPYVIQNSIQNAPPNAAFAWGERYEFGKFANGSGWLISILDGPEARSNEVFGFGPGNGLFDTYNLDVSDTRGINPYFLDPTGGFDDDGNGIPDGDAATNDVLAFGFGSVFVNFEAPAGYFLGFRDYLQNIFGAQLGTVAGPIAYVGNFGFDNGDALDTDDDVNGIARFTDDINGNGINGSTFVFVDLDGDGVFDDDETFLGILTDFGDLHRFNVAFDRVTVRNSTETKGIELMRSLDLGNGHKMAKHQNNNVNIGYGIRYLRLRDQFFFQGDGSIVGRTSVDNKIDNNIFGPQIRAQWNSQRGRINWSLDGRFMWGYNVSNWDQVGLFGQELVPGALNRLLYGQATATAYGKQEKDFSPMAELRAEASYQITSSIAAKLGYSAMYIDNIHRAASEVRWRAPDWGFSGQGSQEIFINGVNFGFDVMY